MRRSLFPRRFLTSVTACIAPLSTVHRVRSSEKKVCALAQSAGTHSLFTSRTHAVAGRPAASYVIRAPDPTTPIAVAARNVRSRTSSLPRRYSGRPRVRRSRTSTKYDKTGFSSEFSPLFFPSFSASAIAPLAFWNDRLMLGAAAPLVNSLFTYKQRERRSISFSRSPLSLSLRLPLWVGCACALRHRKAGMRERYLHCVCVCVCARARAVHTMHTHPHTRLTQPPRHRDARDPSPLPVPRSRIPYKQRARRDTSFMLVLSVRAESRRRGAAVPPRKGNGNDPISNQILSSRYGLRALASHVARLYLHFTYTRSSTCYIFIRAILRFFLFTYPRSKNPSRVHASCVLHTLLSFSQNIAFARS